MRPILMTPILIALLASPAAPPAAAQTQSGEGYNLTKLSFQSVDGAARGYIDLGAYSRFGGDVFYSMDADENGALSLGEFLSWGFGMDQVAEAAGRVEAYETALRVVFAFWDLNGDNAITRTEHRKALDADFRRADANNDAVLSEAEFMSGFTVNVAMRAAINPPPAN